MSNAIGIFDGTTDVGFVRHAGNTRVAEGTSNYTLAGSGFNMWLRTDAFHFAWKKVTGDVAMEADLTFIGPGKHPRRKACILIRKHLDPGSAYADIAVHGDGYTSLQYRASEEALTREVRPNVAAPKRVRLEKRGEYIYVFTANGAEPFTLVATSGRLNFGMHFYIGLGLCSHEADTLETVVFSNVKFSKLEPVPQEKKKLFSTLETLTVGSTDRQVQYISTAHFESPNWTKDGKTLIFNGGGRMLRLAIGSKKMELIHSGFANRCHTDHAISPDGTLLALSDWSQPPGDAIIYTMPIGGSAQLHRVTAIGPSFMHGWSPDGKTICYCAKRDGQYGVFTISADGGEEKRLSSAGNRIDDGPEFTPDGQYIYFSSDRTNLMQIWRMRPDGSEIEQITDDDLSDWFPHVSPDGKYIVFLSYRKTVQGHPAEKDVKVRLMDLHTRQITVLAEIFGGQGTFNGPNWSPDSKQIAFVSYQRLP